jgi:hypothetical protein
MAHAAGLAADLAERLFVAALLHDVGAFSLRDRMAFRSTEATDTQEHCLRGAAFLAKVPWLESAADIVRHHHTPWSRWAGLSQGDEELCISTSAPGWRGRKTTGFCTDAGNTSATCASPVCAIRRSCAARWRMRGL